MNIDPRVKKKLFETICVVAGATTGMLVGFALSGIILGVGVALFTVILFSLYVH